MKDGVAPRISGADAVGSYSAGHNSILNLGKRAAVRTGITPAPGDIILIQDGDLDRYTDVVA